MEPCPTRMESVENGLCDTLFARLKGSITDQRLTERRLILLRLCRNSPLAMNLTSSECHPPNKPPKVASDPPKGGLKNLTNSRSQLIL